MPGDARPTEPEGARLAEVRNIRKYYAFRGGAPRRDDKATIKAVDGVSLSVPRGKTVALVGESGSGKTTLGRLMLRLLEPTEGSAFFQGRDLASLAPDELRRMRRRMQIVFQNPYASLNPRFTVGETIGEGPEVHGIARGAELSLLVSKLLDRMGLPQTFRDRLPAQLSGGERQRVAIARALAVGPELLVTDEATASLDLSVQAQILNLLDDLQAELGLGYLFISHDLEVVRHMADEVAVLRSGKIVEHAPAKTLFATPQHPYTRALLAATPPPDPRVRHRWLPLDEQPAQGPSPTAPESTSP